MVEHKTQQQNGEIKDFIMPLFVVVLGALAAVLNNSSVNVAIPKLMAIFSATTDQIQWVLTAYMLMSGVIIPVTGYLGDTIGTKRLFIISLLIFTLGSFLCSFSWSTNSLIAFRVLQGIGGGAIMPVSMSIIYQIVPREKIGMALGMWGVAVVFGPAVGPTLGGYIVDNVNWRFLFSMNIPVGLMGIILAGILLPEQKKQVRQKFDVWGFVTSSVGCFVLLLALSQGQKEGWDSLYIVSLLVFGGFNLLLFTLIELTVNQPMLDLRILKNPVFTMSTIATSLVTIGLFGGVFLIPLFTQNLLGLTSMQTGLLLLPSALMSAVIMPVSGILFDKVGPIPPAVTGLVVAGVTTFELSKLSLDTSFTTIQVIMAIRALGMGLCMMPITTAGMNVIHPSKVGGASALSNVTRQVAASFGIAVLTTFMQQRQVLHLNLLAEQVSIFSPIAQAANNQLSGLLAQTGIGQAAAQGGASALLVGLAQRQAFVLAIDDTFLLAAVFMFIALPMVFPLKKKKKIP